MLTLIPLLLAGCIGGPGADSSGLGFPAQIGAPRAMDASDMDAYEQIVAQLMNHLEDGVRVLESVEDLQSSKLAAGMFIEASGRIIDLRRQMLEINPHDLIPPAIFVNYAPRYFIARAYTERQRSRIKTLDPAVHEPLEYVIKRLKEQLDAVKKEFEEGEKQAEEGETSSG